MDYKKLYRYLGWKPKYEFIHTMPNLFEWYKEYFKDKYGYELMIDMTIIKKTKTNNNVNWNS